MLGPARLAELHALTQRVLSSTTFTPPDDDAWPDEYSSQEFLGTRPEYGPILPYRD